MWPFLKLFTSKPRAGPFQDPVFGRIVFEGGTWTASAPDPKREFVASIYSPETGPTQIQRDFFRQVKGKIDRLEELAKRHIQSKSEAPIEIEQLHLYSIEIGTDAECKSQRISLELTDSDEILIHGVRFMSEEPVEYYCDD